MSSPIPPNNTSNNESQPKPKPRTKTNELATQQSTPVMQSNEQVIVFDQSFSNDDDEEEEDDAIHDDSNNNSNNHPSEQEGEPNSHETETNDMQPSQQQQQLLTQRFVSWRKHAADTIATHPWKGVAIRTSWSSKINNPTTASTTAASTTTTTATATTSNTVKGGEKQEPDSLASSSSSYSSSSSSSLGAYGSSASSHDSQEESNHVTNETPPNNNTNQLSNNRLYFATGRQSLVDTVSHFRGRYALSSPPTVTTRSDTTNHNNNINNQTTERGGDDTDDQSTNKQLPSQKVAILTQADRIRSLTQHSDVLEPLYAQLKPYQYCILLGRGMLGVNLKQCFLKQKAGAYIDYLVEGGQAQQSGLVQIGDIVQLVADRDVSSDTTIHTIPNLIAQASRPLTMVFATSGWWPTTRSTTTTTTSGANLSKQQPSPRGFTWIDVAVALQHCPSELVQRIQEQLPAVSFSRLHNVYHHHALPLTSVVAPLQEWAWKRNMTENASFTTTTHMVSDTVLSNAFWSCVVDPRRHAFLKAHFGQQREQNNVLAVILDVYNFYEWYHLHPDPKEYATRLSQKYFFAKAGSEKTLQSPEMDVHTFCSDTSLRQLQSNSNAVSATMFDDIVQELYCTYLTGPCFFLEFLQSTHCARMRAYLRRVAPYQSISLHEALSDYNSNSTVLSRNYVQYVIVFLLQVTDGYLDGFGEYDHQLLPESGNRLQSAAHGVCAGVFVRKRLLLETVTVDDFQRFYRHFLAPGAGVLHNGRQVELTKELQGAFGGILCQKRQQQQEELEKRQQEELDSCRALLPQLTTLSQTLLFEFAEELQTRFRVHKFHEWLCDELNGTKTLPSGSIKRLLRRATFPVGVTLHQPSHSTTPVQHSYQNAECAVVFGSSVVGHDDKVPKLATKHTSLNNISRYTSQNIADEALSPDEIPLALESYAVVPMSRTKPFENSECWRSTDGWDVRLVNFILPQADTGNGNSSLYICSLTFQRSRDSMRVQEKTGPPPIQPSMGLSHSTTFFKRMQEQRWSNRLARQACENNDDAVILGLALLCRSNTILAMRETLASLLSSFCSADDSVGDLVDVLGNFAHQDMESDALQKVLALYLKQATEPWLERPLGAQKGAFLEKAGHELLQCLPPIPLALMFATMLLEQKIVLSSSRRSVLCSAVTAVSTLMEPLSWCHLMVPLVPSTLASDLLQYPAPFILGLPSDDPGAMDLIRELPEDVTLVDLDVGRVILAPCFAHDNELGRGIPNTADTARVLRSQVLYLAQCLGGTFGNAVDSATWSCDLPRSTQQEGLPFDRLQVVCRDFIRELLAGAESCCYWIEQVGDTKASPTVLFDEGQFCNIKQSRQSAMSIPMDNFELIVELFLRCQCMNVYIGTRDKSCMMFSP